MNEQIEKLSKEKTVCDGDEALADKAKRLIFSGSEAICS